MEKKLDVKLGTQDERLWKELKDNTLRQIEGLEKGLKVNKAILLMAEYKLKKEQKLKEKDK